MLVSPDSGIKTFKDLEGKKVLTTANAGVNTLFPLAAEECRRRRREDLAHQRAESALVSSYLQGLAPGACWAAWTTSRPRSRPMAASRR